MNIDAGELNRKIVIKKLVKEQDPVTGIMKSNVQKVVRTCWAKVTNSSGREIFQSTRDFSEMKTRFLVRYTPVPLDKKMFIEFRGEYYDINYWNNYGENNEFIEIITTKRV